MGVISGQTVAKLRSLDGLPREWVGRGEESLGMKEYPPNESEKEPLREKEGQKSP